MRKQNGNFSGSGFTQMCRIKDARQPIANAVDPSDRGRAAKALSREVSVNSCKVIVWEWFDKLSMTLAPSQSDRVICRLERDIFHDSRAVAVAKIAAPMLLDMIHSIEQRSAMGKGHRARRICS